MDIIEAKGSYISLLKQNKIYNRLEERCSTDTEGKAIMALVDECVYDACIRSKLIVTFMKQYTLHDEVHLFRVFSIMERLIPGQLLQELSTPELMLLTLSAFFHDLGMAPAANELDEWNKCFDLTFLASDYESAHFNNFKSFCAGHNFDLKSIIALYSNGETIEAEKKKEYYISEYIRHTHADRAREIIATYWNGKIRFHDVDLTTEFAQICYSHNQQVSFLSSLDSEILCGQDIYLSLPFISVILRLADILDFDAKRTPAILFSQMNVKDPISIKEWQKHRSIEAWEIKDGYICFHAKCSHPAIEATVREFCNLIDKELILSKAIINDITQYARRNTKQYSLVRLPSKIDRSKIEAQKDVYGNPEYIFKNTQFVLNKSQVVELLMGTKLYGKTDVPVRELVQNSIDACLVRQAFSEKWRVPYTPSVEIRYIELGAEIVLEIEDNGVGMDQEIIDNFYSQVGCSYYKSPEFYKMRAETKASFQPTSRFGIGVLSCFMITDEIRVETKRIKGPADSSPALDIRIQGFDSIFYIKKGQRELPGTVTRLYLKKENPWSSMEDNKVLEELRMLFPNPPFEIKIAIGGITSTISPSQFNDEVRMLEKPERWREHPNLRIVKVESNNELEGIKCSGFVGWLENDKRPCQQITTTEKTIEIDHDQYTLDMCIRMFENDIKDESASLTLNSEGDIDQNTSYSTMAESNCKLSLHGIMIPMDLFPDPWIRTHQVSFTFPFVCNFKIDILYNRDLNLNSARNEIINDHLWSDFYHTLCRILCIEISNSVSKKYWKQLKKVFLTVSRNSIFIHSLQEFE